MPSTAAAWPHTAAAVTHPTMASTNVAATIPSRHHGRAAVRASTAPPGSNADGAVISTAATVAAVHAKVDRRSQDFSLTATLRSVYDDATAADALEHIRNICLDLPGGDRAA